MLPRCATLRGGTTCTAGGELKWSPPEVWSVACEMPDRCDIVGCDFHTQPLTWNGPDHQQHSH